MQRHSLLLVDRGLQHRHRFRPVCDCGWTGCNHRRSRLAEREYTSHVDSAEHHVSVHRLALPLRALTPTGRLPAVLR